MSKGILVEEHSVKDLFKKLDLIHEQTVKTNGRVSSLERRSIGNWIGNHPFKFSGYCLVFFSLVISDVRYKVLETVLKLWA